LVVGSWRPAITWGPYKCLQLQRINRLPIQREATLEVLCNPHAYVKLQHLQSVSSSQGVKINSRFCHATSTELSDSVTPVHATWWTGRFKSHHFAFHFKKRLSLYSRLDCDNVLAASPCTSHGRSQMSIGGNELGEKLAPLPVFLPRLLIWPSFCLPPEPRLSLVVRLLNNTVFFRGIFYNTVTHTAQHRVIRWLINDELARN